jgi:hypothetical protein
MKRLIQTLILVLSVQVLFGQCQASFNAYYGPNSDSLYLYDQSYSLDSTPLNGLTYLWTVQYGGMTYTSSSSLALFDMNGYSGAVGICLTISNFLGCSSTSCDSIYVNSGQPSGCQAMFGFYSNPVGTTVDFYDQSTVEYLGLPYTMNWTFTGGAPSASTLQNPQVFFPTSGTYQVCLTIVSDSGCTDTYCSNIVILDSNQNNCYLSVIPTITHVSTIGGSDGAIDLSVSGGTPPYTYLWSTGEVTQDISGLPSGFYYVTIEQSNGACSPTTATFDILEPYDTLALDTLYVPPIDTCLNFVPDSFYVYFVQLDSMNATITWTFTGGGMIQTFTVTYAYPGYGPYVIALTFNCDSAKGLTTYMTYININATSGVEEAVVPEFNIYPNPVTDRFTIEMPAGITDVSIYNNMGQIMWSTMNVDAQQLSIDANSWPSGFYMIRMQGAEGKTSAIVIKK